MNTPRTNQILAILLESDGELSEENAPGILVNLCRELETESFNAAKLLKSARSCMDDEQEGVDMICGKIDRFLANNQINKQKSDLQNHERNQNTRHHES